MSTVTVNFEGKAASLVGAVDQVDGKLTGLSKRASTTKDILKGTLAADLVVAGAKKIGAAIGDAWGAVNEQQALGKQTEAVLKSTGGAAGVTGDHVKKLADDLEGMSKTEAEAIQQGSNLLLTFTNIKNKAGEGNDVFDQTTKTMVDMATAMGTEPKAAAMQLGKALNDPIKGIGALSKVGVTFTKQQKDQITAMQKAGDTAGAQKIILAELNKEFGGSAAAAGNTASGAWFKVKNIVDGAIETLLTKALPHLQTLGQYLADRLPGALEAAGAKFAELQRKLQPVTDAIGAFVGFLRDNPETVKAFAITLGVLGAIIGVITLAQWAWNAAMLANPIGLIIVGIAALVAAIVFCITHWDKIKAKASEVWEKMWTATKNGFTRMVSTVRNGILTAARWVASLPGRAWNGLQSLDRQLTTAAARAGQGLVNAIASKINAAVGWLQRFPGRARAAISSLLGILGGAATNAGQRLVNAIAGKINAAVGWLQRFPGRAKSAVGNLSGLLYSAGADLVRGLMNGLDSMAGRALDKARNLGSSLAASAKRVLGIASPSKVFAQIGRDTAAGLAIGLDAGSNRVSKAGLEVVADLTRTVQRAPVATIPIDTTTTIRGTRAAASGIVTNNITVQVPPTVDQATIGRQILDAINAQLRLVGQQPIGAR